MQSGDLEHCVGHPVCAVRRVDGGTQSIARPELHEADDDLDHASHEQRKAKGSLIGTGASSWIGVGQSMIPVTTLVPPEVVERKK